MGKRIYFVITVHHYNTLVYAFTVMQVNENEEAEKKFHCKVKRREVFFAIESNRRCPFSNTNHLIILVKQRKHLFVRKFFQKIKFNGIWNWLPHDIHSFCQVQNLYVMG